MRRFIMRTLVAFITFVVAALGGNAHARLAIVVTLPDLGALAREVAGADATVTVLVEPNQDPHYVDPRPSFLVALSRADVLLYNGLDLEVGWLPPLIVNARNSRIQNGAVGHVDASTFVTDKLQVPTGKVDRAMGDIHPGGNPHFTASPMALAEIARGLGGRLALLDGKNAVAYAQRAEALAQALAKIAEAARVRFASLAPERRQVVVYHDSLPYLSHWLGLEQVATIEEKPGIKPSPGQVAAVLETMRQRAVRVILQERWHPDAASKNLATLAGAKLVVLQGGAEPGQTLNARLEALSQAVYDALAN